jgi:hypothetical protein
MAIGFEKFGMVEDEVRQRFSETLTRRTASRLLFKGRGLSKSVVNNFESCHEPRLFQMKGLDVCEVHQSVFISISPRK